VERKINARIIVQILGCHLKAILLGIVPLRSTVVMKPDFANHPRSDDLSSFE